MPKVIAVLNPKGGSGKTTLSTHLATAFHLAREDVLLVDTDPQGSARDWKAAGESSLPVVGMDRATIDKDLAAIQDRYEWIVLDGGAKLEKSQAGAIKAADLVLIPIQPSPYDVWACAPLIDAIQTRQQLLEGRPACAFVLTRVKRNTIAAREVAKTLEEMGIELLHGSIHDRTIFVTAAAEGRTALELEPDGNAAFEIKRVVKQVREAFA